MAKIKKVTHHGRTRWRLSYYSALGERRRLFFTQKGDAEKALADAQREQSNKRSISTNPRVTVAAYAEDWLQEHTKARGLAANTVDSYGSTLTHHILPAFGETRLTKLAPTDVRRLLAKVRGEGYAVDTVRIIHAVLNAMLQTAVEDGLLGSNPAAGFRKRLKLTRADASDTVKAFTQAQFDTFLATAKEHSPLWDLFLVLQRTGLRIGEALALHDDDLQGDVLAINRKRDKKGREAKPKSGHGREVDASTDVRDVLIARLGAKHVHKATKGWPTLPPYVFVTRTGSPFIMRNVSREFTRVLTLAKLPDHFSLHSLRHTFASLHILGGCKPVWLQQQLGHSSLTLTLNVYGKWFRLRDTAAANRLDAASSVRVGTEVGTETVTVGT